MFTYVFTYIRMYVLCTNVEVFVYAYEYICMNMYTFKYMFKLT